METQSYRNKLYSSDIADEKKKMRQESVKRCDAVQIPINKETNPAEACRVKIFFNLSDSCKTGVYNGRRCFSLMEAG
jgi:hypothetical protein